MAISDVIGTSEPTVFMVEETQTNHVFDAAKLLPVILTCCPYVDSVEFIL